MSIKPDPAAEETPSVARDSEHWLARAAGRFPQRPALSGRGGDLDFAGLARVAAGFALPDPAGAPLAVSLSSRWDLALTVHACLARGVPLLPLDPRLPPSSRDRLLKDCGVRRLLTDVARDDLPSGVQALAPSDVAAPPAGDRGTLGSRVRLIVATSGSGGEPKGVMLTGGAIAAAVYASARAIPLGPGHCWLLALPLHHIGGLAVLYRCLFAGAAVRIHETFDPERLWDDLHRHRVTHLSLVPAMLARLLDAAGERPAPRSLEVLLVGGAALDPVLAARAQRLRWPLCVSYGMSETASQIATHCGPEAGLDPGRVGHPLAGFQVRIGCPDVQGVGRIRVRGPALMAGYATPDLSPGSGLDAGWLETGDLGRLGADGALEVLSRADEVLVTGGENVHPALVEARLRPCPGVAALLVTAAADPVWGDRLVALYQGEAREADLDAFARAHLSGPYRPRVWLRVAELPFGASGKPDRRRARALAEAALSSPRQGPP